MPSQTNDRLLINLVELNCGGLSLDVLTAVLAIAYPELSVAIMARKIARTTGDVRGVGMQPRIRLLRQLRDWEACLREIAEERPQLGRIADEIAAETQKLKAELVGDDWLIEGTA